MFKKKLFFGNYFANSIQYKKNLKKTKKIFNTLFSDLENFEIPMLSSYEKDYEFDFSKRTIKKFSGYKNIIILGMGGSILGTKAIHSFFEKKINKKVFFFDNLDPRLIIKFNKFQNLKSTCFIIVSKSGNTLETISNLLTVFTKKSIKNKLIIITEISDNNLMDIVNKYNAEIIEHRNFIGGRYSVLSETGMFPAAIMGLNYKKFKNLKKLIKNKNFVSSLIHNVASIYTLQNKGLNNSVTLNYDSGLNNLSYWYQQLVAESLGKKGKGINPILSFCPRDHHSLLQLYLDGPKDKFFTFFSNHKIENKFKIKSEIIPENLNFLKNKNIELIINAQCKATKNIFKLKKIPFREITFKKKNEEELGAIFTFFVLETIILSRLMHVNPFNQPAVEEIKIETKRILK